jgi:threonine 3-dehydrogenase
MKAIAKAKAEPGLWLCDVPEPVCASDQLLIKVAKTGICGTDLHIHRWDQWASRTVPVPMVVGHEFVGTVVQVGAGVLDFSGGELVSGEGHLVCGRCRNCQAGRRHLCARTRGVGVNCQGAFAQYISLPAGNVYRHQPGIDLEVAAIFDPFGNAVHTALCHNVLGEDVLITGAGAIGCIAVAVVKHAGARHVVVSDVNDQRLELARRMGADLAINVARDPIAGALPRLGMHEGFDVGLEMSGSTAALRDMIASMCHGGRIAVLGIPGEPAAIDWSEVVTKMLTIQGIYGREMFETWYKMGVMVECGLDISPVITHRYGADEFQRGFAAMAAGEPGKVVLDWSVFS